MLVNCDVKSLELYIAADWYDDPVLKNELLTGINTHEVNQERFKLPTLVIAKIFVFRLLYGASAYGYTTDPAFYGVGLNQKGWQKLIDEFYAKYPGIAKGHERDIKFVKEHGYLEIPSGRFFEFKPRIRNGEPDWEAVARLIKNYPCQGGGADLVKLARIEAYRCFCEAGLEGFFVGTIHDSLIYDVPEYNILPTARILQESVAKVPEMCYNIWSYKFSLPLRCKIEVGPNKRDMKEINV